MTRVDLESLPHDMQAFISALSPDAHGIELTLHGEVIWKLVRPGELSDAERKVLLAHGRKFVRDVRDRVKDTPVAVMKRKVTEALAQVRTYVKLRLSSRNTTWSCRSML